MMDEFAPPVPDKKSKVLLNTNSLVGSPNTAERWSYFKH